jgi:hypothetical protein
MRAAPKIKILIVGNGKLSKHLKHFLHLKNLKYDQWQRDSNQRPEFNQYPVILLAIKDDALLNFYETYEDELSDKQVIHFSGSFYHKKILGIHPLMTFSEKIYEDEIYDQIPLIIDHNIPGLSDMTKNPIIKIDPEVKAKYHALCVLAISAPQIIWKTMIEQLAPMGIHKNEVTGYLKHITENFILNSDSLTGPLVRGDLKTIEKNINSLSENNLKNIYKDLCELKGINL